MALKKSEYLSLCKTQIEKDLFNSWYQWRDVIGFSAPRGVFKKAQDGSITPPVIPFYDKEAGISFFAKLSRRVVDAGMRPRLAGIFDRLPGYPCIVCDHIHNTSDECGKEPLNISERETRIRHDDGYKLIAAENMGCFDDV